jgi:protocatechuate 3,4-dioxygenase beta subunit
MPHLPWNYFSVSRRGFLLGSAAALTSFKGLAGTPACVLASEQEEGPYYVDGGKLRGDITEGKRGVPVKLRVALVNAKTCEPLPDAALDIWHCDAEGVYSGFTANSPDGPGPGRGPGGRGGPVGPGMPPPPGQQFGPGAPPPPGFGPGGRGPRKIDETRFLRGVQITNRQGTAEFSSLYPGWYSGRAIHIHLKVHLGGNMAAETYKGGHVSHTGQLFFPEDLTEQVAKMEPYAKRLQIHRTTQEEDQIFQSQHGSSSMVQVERNKKGSNAEGFIATVTLAIDPEATPRPVAGRGGRGPGGPPF